MQSLASLGEVRIGRLLGRILWDFAVPRAKVGALFGRLLFFARFLRPLLGFCRALWAKVLLHPFVRWHLYCLNFLHELCSGVRLGAAGKPIGPQELLRFAVGLFGIARLIAIIADCFAVLATYATWAGHTKLFALATPARNLNFLFFWHRMPDFLATAASAAMRANALGSRSGTPNSGEQ